MPSKLKGWLDVEHKFAVEPTLDQAVFILLSKPFLYVLGFRKSVLLLGAELFWF